MKVRIGNAYYDSEHTPIFVMLSRAESAKLYERISLDPIQILRPQPIAAGPADMNAKNVTTWVKETVDHMKREEALKNVRGKNRR